MSPRIVFWFTFIATLAFSAFVCVLFLAASPARAEFRFEANTGVAKHDKRKDGLWYQSEYPNEHHLADAAYQLGASWFTTGGPTRYGIRAAYVHLGRISSNSLAIVNEYDRGHNMPCVAATLNGDCFARYQQVTENRGWSFGPVIEHDAGPVVLSAEIGPFFGKQTVIAHVEHITASEQGAVDVTNQWTFTNWFAGAGIRYEYLTLNTRWYQNLAAGGGWMGPRHAYTVLAGLSIPF